MRFAQRKAEVHFQVERREGRALNRAEDLYEEIEDRPPPRESVNVEGATDYDLGGAKQNGTNERSSQ